MGELYLKTLIIMLVLSAFIVPGFILRRIKMLSANSTESLSAILLYVCQPMLIINSLCVFDEAEWAVISSMSKVSLLCDFAIVMAVSTVAFLLLFAICKLIFIKYQNKTAAGIYSFITLFSNCGFIGVPFIEMFSDHDPLASVYVMVFNIVFCVFSWTVGVYFITGNRQDISFKKVILNPTIVASIIALLLFFVPEINFFMFEEVEEIQVFPQYLAYTTTPVSMLIVGIRIADMTARDIFAKPAAYFAGALRLLLAPAVTLCAALVFFAVIKAIDPSAVQRDYAFLAPVISMAMSPAASVVAMSTRFKGDTALAATTFVTSTLISIIIIPLIASAAMSIWGML